MTTDQRVIELEAKIDALQKRLAELQASLLKHKHNISHIADCDCCSFDDSTSAAVMGD